MIAIALGVVLAAAPPAVDKARALAGQQAWEELYLAYSAADPGGYPAKDRKAIGALLLQGAGALEGADPVMAYSLAERAALFDETPGALLLLAKSARSTQQPAAAEEALRRGVKRFPNEGELQLELGKLQLEEQDHQGAAESLARVPKKSKVYERAQALLAQARKKVAEEAAARSEAAALERKARPVEQPGSGAVSAVAHGGGDSQLTGLTYESSVGPGGIRQRANSRFRFRYFNNERDFGQRADYELRVATALDEAYNFSQRILGATRKKPVDVILYTREEFALHNGEAAAQQIAGLYHMGAIRMNDSAELNVRTKTTLVHEYVHAVIDDAANDNAHALPTWLNEGIAEYVEWRYQGGDGPPLGVAQALRSAAQAKQLPSLQQMSGGMLVQMPNPGLAYAFSAVAVRLMIKAGGVDGFMALVKEVGAGMPFEQAFEARYGRDVGALDRDARSEIGHR